MSAKRWPIPATLFLAAASVSPLLATAGCQHSPREESAPVENTGLISVYAPQDGIEAPFQPEASRARRFHVFARRVRHRHAGPR
jgi:hypothetical protein